jgi:hypothetical protein
LIPRERSGRFPLEELLRRPHRDLAALVKIGRVT